MLGVLVLACGRVPDTGKVGAGQDSLFVLTSPAFEEGKPIPRVHTADGEGASPPLEWSHVPAGTQSFALTCEDLDVANRRYIHWVAYNIPESTRSLAQGAGNWTDSNPVHLPGAGYFGMAPEHGQRHRYRFRLYAMDTQLELSTPVVDAAMLEGAVARHVLAQADLTGTYYREAGLGGWWR